MKKEDFIKIQESLELTNVKLAEVLGVTVRAVSHYKKGSRPIPTSAKNTIYYYHLLKKNKII
jgi:predicted transcriptional regulator